MLAKRSKSGTSATPRPHSESRPLATKRRARAVADAPSSVAQRINERLERENKRTPAKVYTPFDFIDLGTSHSVGMVLTRLVRSGRLQRVARGLYYVPRHHPLLGELRATADEIAQALARRRGASLRPSEAMAANLLGLTEQVPARPAYETDGPNSTVKVGTLTVELKRRPSRQLGSVSPISHLVFAAFRNIGKVHINTARIAHLKKILPPDERARLLEDLPLAPAWMHPYLRFIAGSGAATHR